MITPDIANHVLHFRGLGGYTAGWFEWSLMESINRANMLNLGKLRTVFPDYVAAMSLTPEELEELAKFPVGGSGR